MEVTDLERVDPEAEARVLMDSDLGLARDVVTDELLHTELITLSDDRHFFYQRVHHLMLDGYSAVLVLQRVAEQYEELLDGAEPGGTAAGNTAPRNARAFGSLAELLAAENAYSGSDAADADRDYWESSCGTPRPRQDLPAGPRAPPVRWSAPPDHCRPPPPPRYNPPRAPRPR